MPFRRWSHFFDPLSLKLSKRREKIENAFFDTVQQNDLHQMKSLLQQYPFLFEVVKARWGGNEMCAAVVVHDIQRVYHLLESGYSCNTNFEERPLASAEEHQYKTYSLLYLAVKYRADDIVTLLLTRGADPNRANEKGYTPLHLAAKHNALILADALLGYDADINAQDYHGDTPLHWAAEAGHIDFCNFLLEKGADFTVRNCDGDTLNDYFHLSPTLDVEVNRRRSFSSSGSTLVNERFGDDETSASIRFGH